MGEDFADRLVAAGDRPVDPFVGQQQRAFHTFRTAQFEQRPAQVDAIGKPSELVKRGNAVWLGRDGHNKCPIARETIGTSLS